MKIYKVKDYAALSQKAADLIAAQVILKPDCVLGLATGSTPIGTYENLVKKYENGSLDFSQLSSINLDEYKGLDASNDQSYRYFMNHHLFSKVNINMAKTYVPDGTIADSEEACKQYNQIIHELGGADLQLLGLGHNGHIGFNEPADYFPKETYCVDLAESTIQANKRFFADESMVPRQAYTMGIQTILSAKMVLVLVSGEGKAEILSKVINGPVTPQVPASILQFHPNTIIVADEAALSKTQL